MSGMEKLKGHVLSVESCELSEEKADLRIQNHLVLNPQLTGLNAEQHLAVETTEGPLLVLAGAGTGKTRVLTARIAYILQCSIAFPSQILAVTFTNKAAREMRERVEKIVPGQAAGLWLGTFHSIGVRILRRHAELLGFPKDFTILDQDDQVRVLKQLLQEHGIDEKRWPAKTLSAIIQRFKDRGLTPDKVNDAGEASSFANGKTVALYEAYQLRLKTLKTMDFGDLLLHMLTLFTRHPDVLGEYQRRFHYILVDEYQDTNVAQYLWLRLLSQGHNNLCCVGDDDQSIYGWRGAEVDNILRFEKDFVGAKIIRLERNYRSTPDILAVASTLISHNKGRLGKTLWADRNCESSKVKVVSLWDEKKEAEYIADEIEALRQLKHQALDNMAILVRAGFQTRAFEECFISRSIPYKVLGGLRFYERMEIRDAIAYMRFVLKEADDLAFERIINTPKRGIGEGALETIRSHARARNISLLQATQELLREGGLKPRLNSALSALLAQRERWRKQLETTPHADAVDAILDESGYLTMWKLEKTPEAQGRVENLKELINALEDFENLDAFLEHVSLVMDADDRADEAMVSIMTMHGAKGLEFDNVFLAGWEEGLFPSSRSVEENGQQGLEEERRLAYVGITRARQRCTISFTANRRVYHQWQSNIPSRFVDELPPAHIEIIKASFGPAYQAPKSRGPGVENRVLRERATPSYSSGLQENTSQIPPSNAQPFSLGQRVTHPTFGYGRIVKIDGKHLTIGFANTGIKTILEEYVKKV